MTLLIDFGNSYCKWVQVIDGYWQHVNSFAYDRADQVSSCLQHLPLSESEQIHIVSVLGAEFDARFQQAVDTNGCVHFHQSQLNAHGIQLGYSEAANYGVDRYATLVAAHQQFSGHKIIVDCGTAITLDVLEENGQHLGGIIVPGVDTMCESLQLCTSGITSNQDSARVSVFADDSADAVYSGAVLVASYGLQGVIRDVRRSLGRATLIFTGGGRNKILGFDHSSCVTRPYLVLEGVAIMAHAGLEQQPTTLSGI